jgi:predicted phosphate transport protein (TIGR00153 family)
VVIKYFGGCKLAFPSETEEQIRRIVLDMCQDHIRKILESVRELTLMMDDFANKTSLNGLEQRLLKIRQLKEEASELKRALLRELAETGMLLISREDLMRLVNQMNDIADLSEEGAFRINAMNNRKITIEKELLNDLLNMAKNVLKAVNALRETVLSLKFSRDRTIDLAKNVEAAEYVVDEIYRNIDTKIIDMKMDISYKLFLREVSLVFENIADKAEDAIDSARILALSL